MLAQKSTENSQQVKDDAFRGADRVAEGLQRETEKGHGHSWACNGLVGPLSHGSYDFSLCLSLLRSFLHQLGCSSAQPGIGASTEGTPTSLPLSSSQHKPVSTKQGFQELSRGFRENCSLVLSTPCAVICHTHAIMFKPKGAPWRWPGRGGTGTAAIGRPHFPTENCPLPSQEALVGAHDLGVPCLLLTTDCEHSSLHNS